MKMSEEEIEERIEIYKRENTHPVQPRKCASCHCDAEVHDASAGEDYCYDHLEEALKEDLEGLKDCTDKYYNKTEG